MFRLLAIVLVISTPLSADPISDQSPPNIGKHGATEEPAEENKGTEDKPRNVQIPPVQVPETKEPNERAANTSNDNREPNVKVTTTSVQSIAAEENLIQQTRIADYTSELVDISRWQVGVNSVVASFIFLTLVVTALTAKAAQRSAKAAEEVIKQNRAWITFGTNGKITPPKINGIQQVPITWTNSGKSPALEVKLRQLVCRRPQPAQEDRSGIDVELRDHKTKWSHHGAVGPGMPIHTFLGMTTDIITDIKNPDICVLVALEIRYKTTSGDDGFTKTILEAGYLGHDNGVGNAGLRIIGKQVCT